MPLARVALPTGSDVLAYLGWAADSGVLAQADQHTANVVLVAKSYVRGRGFEITGQVADDIAAVIVSAAARSLSNPAQDRRIEAGSFNSAPGSFASWSLAEAAVLHEYRQRAG